MSSRYEDRRFRSAVGAGKLRWLLRYSRPEGKRPGFLEFGVLWIQKEAGSEVCEWAVKQGLVKEINFCYERTALGEAKLKELGG